MNIRHLTLHIFLGLVAVSASAQESLHSTFGVTFSYKPYTKALSEYVDDKGMVNYAELKTHRDDLDVFIRDLAGLYTDMYDDWDKDRQLAYWLNAYNAFTLVAITDNYPIKSNWKARLLYPNGIRHIPGVWEKANHMAKGSMISLEDIEHKEIRPVFKDPRVHMALVCAARGCPSLRNEPYLAENLDEQLADQAKQFLSDPLKFRVDEKAKVVHLSSIFKWFGDDFIEQASDKPTVPWGSDTEKAVMAYIGEHLEKSLWEKLTKGSYSVSYLDYDWSLNEQ